MKGKQEPSWRQHCGKQRWWKHIQQSTHSGYTGSLNAGCQQTTKSNNTNNSANDNKSKQKMNMCVWVMLKSESLNVLKWHSTFYFVLFFVGFFQPIPVGHILPFYKTVDCERISNKNNKKTAYSTTNAHIHTRAYFLSFFRFSSIFLLAEVIFLLCSRLHSPCRCTHSLAHNLRNPHAKCWFGLGAAAMETMKTTRWGSFWFVAVSFAQFFLVKDKFIANSQTSINVIIICIRWWNWGKKKPNAHSNNNISKQRDRSANRQRRRWNER